MTRPARAGTWPARCGLALALLAGLALPAEGGAASPLDGEGVRLSDERTLTRWAHPEARSPIRSRPTADSRRITSTHFKTEDGFPEVYLALRRWIDPRDQSWIQVRIPMRPNGRKGWVRKSALGPLYRVATQLVVDRSHQHASLYRDGRRVWSAPVGVGKASTPTPAGNFWVREKFKTGDPDGIYGPMAFGTSDYSVLSDWPGGGVIGIHGTSEPWLIPGRPSHGCIRVRNADLRRLWPRLPIGTPILIR